jgi:hypothetical protein
MARFHIPRATRPTMGNLKWCVPVLFEIEGDK